MFGAVGQAMRRMVAAQAHLGGFAPDQTQVSGIYLKKKGIDSDNKPF